ncbi:MAG: cation:proton antiporter [Spirochaetia bacterium]|nr:cation:proton antiporter [Spirochaetia bacterium]
MRFLFNIENKILQQESLLYFDCMNDIPVEQVMMMVITTTLISVVFNVILKKIGMSPALGYILAGIAISYLFGLEKVGHQRLHNIAEFGIVFMLFTIGLEFSVDNLRRMVREVAFHGSLQFVFTSLVFYLLARYGFGISVRGSIITGFAIALSSTAIVLKYIHDNRDTGRTYAREATGILIFQDISVIAILLMVGIFSDRESSISMLLLNTAFHAFVVLALLYIVGHYILNHFFVIIVGTRSHEIFIASVLMIVVSAAILAHSFGFTYSLGAFIAGIMIAETHYKYQVEADLTPFRDILLGVFFVSVGMQVDLHFFLHQMGIILVMVLAIMTIKAAIIYIILRFTHWRITSLKTAVSLSQVGEFSFVVFEMAQNRGLVSGSFAQQMIIVVTISMILTPFILNYQNRVFKIFKRIVRDEEEPSTIKNPGDILIDHIIVIGYGYHGRRIVEDLVQKEIPYIVIEFRHELVKRGHQAGHHVVFGNAAQKAILNKAGIQHALAAIISIEEEKQAILIAQRISEIGEHINVVVKSTTNGPFNAIQAAPGLMIVNEPEEIAKILIHYALSCDIKP